MAEEYKEEFFDAEAEINKEDEFVDERKPGSSKVEIDEDHLEELEALMTDAQKKLNRDLAVSMKEEGNEKFKDGHYEEAIEKYTAALTTCPPSFITQRSQLFANRAAADMKLKNYESAIKDCTAALKLDEEYWKALFRRAWCYEQNEDHWHLALDDYKMFLKANPDNQAAASSLNRLTPMVEQRNERMKTEMMGKLKDLGNLVLRPFGLSTDNFRMEQNAEGGYSVNMNNN